MLVGVIVACALIFGAGTFALLQRTGEQPAAPKQQASTPTARQKVPNPPKPPLIDLQPVVDQWVAAHSGDYGIAVYDPDNKKMVATHQADKQFFTASIYKLYVVYLQLIDIQKGVRTADELFRGDYSRQKCIEEAVRTSDSPCAEALMAELTQASMNTRLQAYGLTSTAFPGFVTSAEDVAKILIRFQANQDLSQANTSILRTVMEQQIYRKGLPDGMPQATVADKVGFSETPHYHDVGIVTLPNKRQYVVVFLSQGVGTRVVADFGKTIFATLNQ